MWLISFLIVFLTTPLFSAPVITRIDGSLIHNSSVTINGSGFGEKDPAKPYLWADFEDGSINPSWRGQITSWTSNQGMVLISSNQYSSNSSYSVIGDWGAGGGFPYSHSFRLDKSSWTTMYVYAKRMFDHGVTSNQKFFRLNSTGTNNFVMSTSNDGIFLNEVTMGDDRFQPFTKPSTSVWTIEEFRWTHGGSGCEGGESGAGLWNYSRNGSLVQLSTMVCNNTDNLTQLRVLDNFTDVDYSLINGKHIYMDDLYVDTTPVRVMVSTNSTWAKSTIRDIQVPYSWADGEIKINLRLPASQSKIYAYVILDSTGSVGNVNENGYECVVTKETKLNRMNLRGVQLK